jgi:8-oxo-dGTP pyrophosphatase MutT (NUDIX family)
VSAAVSRLVSKKNSLHARFRQRLWRPWHLLQQRQPPLSKPHAKNGTQENSRLGFRQAAFFCLFWRSNVLTPLSKLPHFDPRKVPLVGTDAHLPAVPAQALSAAALRARFAHPPAWQPEVVAEFKFSDRKSAAAAVLIALVMREQPTVLLTQRSAHLSTHSGQIAFPGGKTDDTDLDAGATALREAHEEVGLAAQHVQVLGHLPLYVTGTAFYITPVVALVEPGFELTLNASEVDSAFEVPLAYLMNPANHRRHAFEFEGVRREWFSMPYTDLQVSGSPERFIWGATAGMLRNFYRFLSAAL